MNPVTDHQPLPHAPPRSSFSCDRHPNENFTGFCPSCLCERLTTLDQSANAGASSSSRRNSVSSIKSVFKTRNSVLPELRRTKSFSASKNEGLAVSASVYEPQRKSCDVRGRNTNTNSLWSLFSIHDENKPRRSFSHSQQQTNLGQNGVVLETNEEEGNEVDHIHEVNDEDGEIRVTEVTEATTVSELENNIVEKSTEIEEIKEIRERKVSISDELKPMKDHINIDLDSHSKKSSRSNFWSAASVLTKKWQKWRRKQKKSVAGSNGVVLSSTLPVEKPLSRQFRETQSEIADYGFGRRSCDTDPRFSLDAGRISFDDPRYSFDEPRASWDGYLVGRTFPRLPPMVEDVPIVRRCDSQIPVEMTENTPNAPGGLIQTREYYLDSSSKRRKSLDRSNSFRRMAASVVAELDATKVNNIVSNTKVSPATIDATMDNGRIDPPRVSNSNSLRDDISETFELGFRDRENVIPIGREKDMKKPRRWKWKLWGFIRRSKDDDQDEDRCSNVSSVGRSYSESWQDLRRDYGNEGNNGFNRKVFRSNSSVNWRSSSLRKSNSGKVVVNERGVVNGKNRRAGDEFGLERNGSTRYSSNHVDNGLLRFYLAPLSGSRRSGIGGKSRPLSNPHMVSRNMVGLY